MRRSKQDSPVSFLGGLLRLIAFLGLSAGGVIGCGPEVPANPDYEQHVRPILAARCVRCHSNPTTRDLWTGTEEMTINLDFPTAADIPTSPLDRAYLLAAYAYASGEAPPLMPPPPAASLEDWQIETLERWAMMQQ